MTHLYEEGTKVPSQLINWPCVIFHVSQIGKRGSGSQKWSDWLKALTIIKWPLKIFKSHRSAYILNFTSHN